MVQQGDFKVELVHADSKQPFKEHYKDGKVFVEVEPEAEYYISLQRTGDTVPSALNAKLFVDEKDLGYHKTYTRIKGNPSYVGIRHYEDGKSSYTALRFAKPRILVDGSSQSAGPLMGRVRVKIYEGVFAGEEERQNQTTTFEEPTIGQEHGGLAKKKGLRSTTGEHTISKKRNGTVKKYKTGRHVDTFTLQYCAAVGLIEAGVLDRPGHWAYRRMKHPAGRRDDTEGPPTKKMRAPSGEENDLVDLSELPEENDD